MSENWIKVADTSDVPEDGTLLVNLGAEPVCLYKLGGKIFATHDTCTHGQASLADGFIEGEEIECPLHQGKFHIATGKAVGAPCTEELKGKRIGVPEWAQTAVIYSRGYLTHQAKVPLASVEWVQAGVNQAGRVEKVKPKLPEGVRLRPEPQRSLNDMLLAGDIDAVLSARPPRGFGSGIRRLFPAYEAVEAGYFRETGILPSMHGTV